jgi:hypothetical protein
VSKARRSAALSRPTRSTATIRARLAEGANTVDDLKRRDVVNTTYDRDRADFQTHVPDGWQLLFLPGT